MPLSATRRHADSGRRRPGDLDQPGHVPGTRAARRCRPIRTPPARARVVCRPAKTPDILVLKAMLAGHPNNTPRPATTSDRTVAQGSRLAFLARASSLKRTARSPAMASSWRDLFARRFAAAVPGIDQSHEALAPMHRLFGPKRTQHLASATEYGNRRGEQDAEQVSGLRWYLSASSAMLSNRGPFGQHGRPLRRCSETWALATPTPPTGQGDRTECCVAGVEGHPHSRDPHVRIRKQVGSPVERWDTRHRLHLEPSCHQVTMVERVILTRPLLFSGCG